MFEQRLRDLGHEAERLVDLPELGGLERRGAALRWRRQAGAVMAAVVLVTGLGWLMQDRTDRDVQPAPPIDPRAGATAYPGSQMVDLVAGTYELTPSSDGHDPTVLVTVPKGWNAADGPNRFDGHLGTASNEEALAQRTWLVGVLLLKVIAVATEPCQTSFQPGDAVTGYSETVRAISRLPGYRVVGGAAGDDRFGHPATHLRLVADQAESCQSRPALFESDVEGVVATEPSIMDIWVVDVEGTTLVVDAVSDGDVPQRFEDELAAVVASIEFVIGD